MTMKIHYDSTLDALVIEVTGSITYEDLPPLAQQIVAHPNFRTNINQLFDCTKGQLDLSYEDLKRIAKDFMAISEVLGSKRRLALAVSRAVDFGMMRQYEVFFSGGPEVEVRAFSALPEAKVWLEAESAENSN